MSTTSDAIKEIVYSHIDGMGRDSIRSEFATSHGESFLAGAPAACMNRVRDLGLGAEGEAAMLTSILHFALSAAAVPSHRKAAAGGTELDIVIPGTRALLASPESAMILCIPPVSDAQGARRAAEAILGVQRVKSNIAVALVPSARGAGYTGYSVQDGTFQNIIRDARAFLASTGGARMGIAVG